MSKASWKASMIMVIGLMNVGRFTGPGAEPKTASTAEQVLVAHISHLQVELRQRLAAQQLTGRLS